LAPKDTSLEGTLNLDKPPYCINASTNTLIKLLIVEPSTTLYMVVVLMFSWVGEDF
jgi:hypothetical protein